MPAPTFSRPLTFLPLRASAVLLLTPSALLADPDILGAGAVQALDGSGLATGSLHPLNEPAVTFAAFGDFGNGSALQGAVATMVRGWQPDFIVTLGDNNYGLLLADPAAFQTGKTDWTRLVGDFYGEFMLGRADGLFPEQTSLVQRFFPCVGNHDSAENPVTGLSTGATGGTIDGYLTYFLENPGGTPRLPVDRGAVHNRDVSHYAVRKGPVDIFVIDSDALHAPGLIDPQKTWLAARLAESTARWKIAVFHQPPYTSSFRGGNLWMRWPELMHVDAILTGHDHFYERLVFGEDGPPLFVSGAGGQPTYGRSVPVPESRFFEGGMNSALRITASEVGLKFECRGTLPADGSEVFVDSLVLGENQFGDEEDAYSFYAESGSTFILESRTPAPVDHPPLNPLLEVKNAADAVLHTANAGQADGRNVWTQWTAPETGQFRLNVRAEGLGRGNYVVLVTPVVPPGGFGPWKEQRFPAGGAPAEALADPDEDGMANVIEYCLGLAPTVTERTPPVTVTGTPAGAVVSFDVPVPLPLDAALRLEMSTDLSPDRWMPVATRTPLSDWQSPGALTTELLAGGARRRVTLTVAAAPGVKTRFFRLRALIN